MILAVEESTINLKVSSAEKLKEPISHGYVPAHSQGSGFGRWGWVLGARCSFSFYIGLNNTLEFYCYRNSILCCIKMAKICSLELGAQVH